MGFRTHGGGQYYHQEFDAFDLFAEMFGGSFQNSRTRFTQPRRQQQQRQTRNRTAAGQQANNQQAIGPVLMMIGAWLIMLLFMGNSNSEPQKYYSMQKNRMFPVEK